jgi:hypothetical protein
MPPSLIYESLSLEQKGLKGALLRSIFRCKEVEEKGDQGSSKKLCSKLKNGEHTILHKFFAVPLDSFIWVWLFVVPLS